MSNEQDVPGAASVSPVAAGPAAARGPAVRRVGLLLAWLLAIVALVTVLLLWQRVGSMQTQLALQSSETSKQAIAAHTLAEQANEEVRHTAGKLAALDAQVRDLAAYRAQMKELVQSVVQARDQGLLANLDASLRLAQDQAQLTGSPQPLLVALRAAERRMARSPDARFTPVLQAVARDLQRLQDAEVPDTAGLLTRIDQLLQRVDGLPVAGAAPEEAAASSAAATSPDTAQPEGWFARMRRMLGEKLCGESCARPVSPSGGLASGSEYAALARQNLKLRLQGARLGILARQYESARADLAAAAAQLATAYVTNSVDVSAAVATLQQIRQLTRAPDLPRLDDTLTALGNAAALEPTQ